LNVDALRSLKILKNRYQGSDKIILYKFNGAINYFSEFTDKEKEKFKWQK
jgi:outer membrane biogenesis lipoprotein LolB